MNDPKDQPINDYMKIRNNLTQIARQEGLELQAFNIIPPNSKDGPVSIQAIFSMFEPEPEPDTEQQEIDAIFTSMMKEEQLDPTQIELEKIRNSMKDGKGIFGD